MVVEVLNPQDCLKHPSSQGLLSLPMKYHHRNPNPPPPNRAARPQPDRRKPQKKSARPNTGSPVQKAPVPLLTGPVKILKRGEEFPKPVELPNPSSKENRSPPKQKVPDLGSALRSGPKPNPKKAPKQTRLANPVNPALGFYAGSAFCVPSPPPSSLPLPSFFPKKTAVVSTTNEAGSEILKLIGLNLS